MKTEIHREHTIVSRLKELPTYDYIEIHEPFDSLIAKHFRNRNLDMVFLESGSIMIFYNKMNLDEKISLLKEIRTFLKDSRQEVIDNYL